MYIRTGQLLGNLEEADELCIAALGIKPASREALLMRADIADISDMADETIRRLEQVIRATEEPTLRARLRERLATRCHAMNQKTPGTFPPSAILDHLAQAVKEAPNNVAIIATYAEYCLIFKKYDDAAKWARIILTRFNRHHVRAKEVLFECAIGKNRFDEAQQILDDRYINFDPDSPTRNYQQARLEMLRGRYNEALAQLDEMETKAAKGAVLTLLYHDLTESDWLATTSVRRLYEHLLAMKQAGFEFVSPAEIGERLHLGDSAAKDAIMADSQWRDSDAGAAVPLPARVVDYLRYSFTGERKFAPASKGRRMEEKWSRPAKQVAITFDDGLRNTFELATPVAEDIGVPFGMFIITEQQDFQPSIAPWSMVNEFVATGAWVIGSHLTDAHTEIATSADTNHLARALANRKWLPYRKRLESMNEWDRRMRSNFRDSLKVLHEKLTAGKPEVDIVAYPYGDIGQEDACNLSVLRNPVNSILYEAARTYQLGFALNRSGYTTYGGNRMLVGRYEPPWYAEGDDIVRHAYENHPLFMARTLRIELAQVMGKPHLAEEVIQILRRDGYPEALLHRIAFANKAHFRNRPQRTETTLSYNTAAYGTLPTATLQASQYGVYNVDEHGELTKPADDGKWYTPSDLSVGAHLYQSKANNEYEVWRGGLRSGFNLGQNTWLGAEATYSEVKQKRRPLRTIDDPEDFDSDYLWDDTEANLDVLPGAKATRKDIRLRLTHRLESGAALSASLGLAHTRLKPNEDWDTFYGDWDWDLTKNSYNKVVGDFMYSWYPTEKVGMSVYYSHDLLSVAYRLYQSDSIGINSRWKVSDTWIVDIRGQYSIYSDDNAMYQMGAESFWEIAPEFGLWFGLQYAMATTSDYNPYYWTPFWDQRASTVLRYAEAWQGRTFYVDFIFGRQREGKRMQDHNDWGAVFGSASDWHNAWGIGGTFRQQFKNNWEVVIDVRTMFLRNYADHSFYLSIDHTF
ncbi:MAG: polysaccharide deacetylase family protein [Lentisphaerae bacterium]|nr:polysaccharide deacetylase family protein [Lentisphaerota bacterium]